MFTKIHKLIILIIIILCAVTVKAKVTPVPINQFKGSFGTQFYNSGSPDVLSFEGKALKINENAKKYVSGMGICLNNFSDNSGKQIFTKSIPMKAVNPQPIVVGKSSFANRMFYAYPLRRIDFSNKNAKLPHEILDYLKKYGAPLSVLQRR